MQHDFWPNSKPKFAETREEALARLAEFSQTASRYSRERNHVVSGHPNVSRLSPAIRHRLISEEEAARAVLERYAFSTVEKFLQEIYWRRYWKSWLAMRPQVWTEYLMDLATLKEGEDHERAQEISEGRGPIAVMNDFAHELIETGYLHNHARMWFAAYWIHTLRLPWQLGSDFFYRHLLDADPASNTLSWRWVAGLQTIGKSYLARRSNIEKYLHPDLLKTKGLELLENPSPASVQFENAGNREIKAPVRKNPSMDLARKTILWLHEEDLSVETWINRPTLAKIGQVIVTWDSSDASRVKKSWLEAAITDAVSRWNIPTILQRQRTPTIENEQFTQVIAVRPEIGPLNDTLPEVEQSLSMKGMDLHLVEREEDLLLQGAAKGGFFSFWKSLAPNIRSMKEL